VRDGSVLRTHRVRLVRDGTIVFTGRIASLRREKDDIKEAREGFECGIRIEGYDDVKVGDVIETFQIEKIARTLASSQGGPAAAASPA
jgi:translation initiation factor IF-2